MSINLDIHLLLNDIFFLRLCIIHENQSEWEAFKIISQDVVGHHQQNSIFNVVVGANWSLYARYERDYYYKADAVQEPYNVRVLRPIHGVAPLSLCKGRETQYYNNMSSGPAGYIGANALL